MVREDHSRGRHDGSATQVIQPSTEGEPLLVLANTAMTRFVLVSLMLSLVSADVALTQDRPGAQLTLAEYQSAVERVLPCPDASLRETRDFRLCLLIVPPGHREERELLVALTYGAGAFELLLSQPEIGLWRYANEAKDKGKTGWAAFAGLRVRTVKVTDANVIRKIAGRSWTTLTTGVVPQRDWFTDATLYRITAESQVGRIAVELEGPGPSARRQPSELLAWAERVRKQGTELLRQNGVVSVIPQ